MVVRVTSVIPSMAVTCEMSSGRSVRSSGSPPVMRALDTPNSENSRVSRVISSNVSISPRGRNSYASPKISAGMQYGQRKLHRSVTEMRRSRMDLPMVSITFTDIDPYANCLDEDSE